MNGIDLPALSNDITTYCTWSLAINFGKSSFPGTQLEVTPPRADTVGVSFPYASVSSYPLHNIVFLGFNNMNFHEGVYE